jgi:hypothetical protein
MHISATLNDVRMANIGLIKIQNLLPSRAFWKVAKNTHDLLRQIGASVLTAFFETPAKPMYFGSRWAAFTPKILNYIMHVG